MTQSKQRKQFTGKGAPFAISRTLKPLPRIASSKVIFPSPSLSIAACAAAALFLRYALLSRGGRKVCEAPISRSNHQLCHMRYVTCDMSHGRVLMGFKICLAETSPLVHFPFSVILFVMGCDGSHRDSILQRSPGHLRPCPSPCAAQQHDLVQPGRRI